MATPEQTETQIYQPSQSQLERASALRRFNWLYVYGPVIVFSLIGLVLVGLLLWGVFSPNVTGAREFASGLADLVMIFTIMPLLLLCAIVPAAAIGLVVYRRQQPKQEHGRFQTLLWRLDTLVTKAKDKTAQTMPKAAAPVIKGHAWVAYIRTLLAEVKKQFTRR
ncbi:MAG: hypothetical protein H6667_01545 [Ardenticatenaceae bacterium]|nr:hypothetical protein [Ardenticatenaceae bacterium]